MNKFIDLTDKSIDSVKNTFNTIKHYDVNSLYPSVMIDNEYPTDIICKFIGNIKNSEYSNLYENNLGIYHVKVKAPNNKHPLLLIKNE